ncbi:NADH-quinone oxidoreductase subunit L [Rhizobium sp. VS19-DR104.2]|uniref:NADH-quinone oxidoreductase subunit L n=1 Tax=unclassified Rhizobium TaxID=2613769 RepID=UPI001C5BE313|nr:MULTISPECIES: NADH-quinone oxidoreductase subunit L [unclassified Rhizobium]MBZ5760013.1 NADH-quinone oxidoreductase subunit L [Rhizobium sp. VS19-DR96]MBZ5766506.1 NADH-quinone oxidoreductase subunit L [Rhizobium sp. VS19-DR129.2]MBZ5774151.1 NADH-quinone oxidoreductase subunit L [Rhizobium sp. VS19-DRK62.2]MBZ5785223.1 NADH-quinone oxidoreductase subunit L [Rhizobium sp. VS19-DR121]MBZ5802822.1 NADH-quinone oxidoreductase subunit L [Rhizobium sp. VS19-DR181]
MLLYKAIVFLPLIGALIVGYFGRQMGAKASEYLTSGLMIIVAVLSWIVFFQVALGTQETLVVDLFRWMQSGRFDVSWQLRIDTLTAVMFVVVNTVSTLVHIYSIGYMHDDPNRPRFFAYLSLFTFMMLMLVTANNLLQLFFGWEGVGLSSYLLIGFWFQKPSANAAAIKAFVVNRIGDFGFLLGIAGVFVLFGSVSFDVIFSNAQSFAANSRADQVVLSFLGMHLNHTNALTAVCLLLFMGAMGKSAQFLLHTWLPDAMEGPTPVSALIHAATMVTAGVFLVARMSPLFELSPDALVVVTTIGAITAFFAATVGLVQNDIKRVIAYSTCSQLGYMFVALGVGAYGPAIFHLFTHAFFKALLFLCAGSVIHSVGGEQDMRKMGGLRPHIQKTFWMMIVGTLAITGFGIPFTSIGFAGFFSKDAIIEASFASNSPVAGFAFTLLVIAALFTSFYSWRLIFLTFFGKPRASHEVMHHVHESPNVMLVPLYVLGLGALAAGFLFHSEFVGEGFEHFWKGALFMAPTNHILEEMEHLPTWVELSPFIAMVIGFVLAWYMYIKSPETPKALARQQRVLYEFLLNKWYFDELYDFLFVRSSKALGRFLWHGVDEGTIDRFGPNGVAARVVDLANQVVRLQTGYLYHYAFAMLLGVAALVTWMMLGSSI